MKQQLAGKVELQNTEYIHPKFEALIGVMLTMKTLNGKHPSYALRRVIFNIDDTPADSLAMYYAGNETVEFNLKRIFYTSLKIVSWESTSMNISATIWYGLIEAMFHEMHHARMWAEEPAWMEENFGGEAETIAQAWAREMLTELAVETDIEPPSINEMPFFKDLWAEEVNTYDMQAVVQRQIKMIANGHIYRDPRLNIQLTNLREYVQITSGYKDDPRWRKAAKPIEMLRKVAAAATEKPAANMPPPPPVIKAEHLEQTAPQTSSVSHELAEELDQAERDALMYAEAMDDAPTEFGGTSDNEDGPLPMVDPIIEHKEAELNRPRAKVSIATVKQVCITVYLRINAHVYNKCGYRGNGWFDNPAAATEKIFIGDIPNMKDVLINMDILDSIGKPRNGVPITDWISGTVVLKNAPDTGSPLPCYKFSFTCNGKVYRRAIIPQNPTRSSWGAKHVAAGGTLLWVTNDEPGIHFDAHIKKWLDKDGNIVKKWVGLVKDGRYIACNK